MKKGLVLFGIICAFSTFLFSFSSNNQSPYIQLYNKNISSLVSSQNLLLDKIQKTSTFDIDHKSEILQQIFAARRALKNADIWLRYFESTAYKSINGPLPVEWETEVFEKYEKPYRRTGAGLTLASLYLDEENISKDSLAQLIKISLNNIKIYQQDSITKHLTSYHHFFLANRLFLLNLAAIYTTGFECPIPDRIIPELQSMLIGVNDIYTAYNNSFPEYKITSDYLNLYQQLIDFVAHQPNNYAQFNHYSFIREYVNPLFAINQKYIINYKVISHNLQDYSLNKKATSIFSKELYLAQNTKGIYHRIQDTAVLQEISHVGKLLFFDPILSGNNSRSCASCHKPEQYYTDTSISTALHFNKENRINRNTPTLLNSAHNHLIMQDGRHLTLQEQCLAVIANPDEMNGRHEDVLNKVLSCKQYKSALKKFAKLTPTHPEVSIEHVASAITLFYGQISSNNLSPFDDAMNHNGILTENEIRGFNVFMSKAQCATCHFVPQFNGVKPPYIGSEFEVIGIHDLLDKNKLSKDEGRYIINPANETKNAFRTNTIRNAARTAPYMHNGALKTLTDVINFYDAGGGSGMGIVVRNQTLSSDSLHLSQNEKSDLISFIESMNEKANIELKPNNLPKSKIKALNKRAIGGQY